MAERSRNDPLGYPTLPSGRDQYHKIVKAKFMTGIVTSDGTYSVATVGCTEGASRVTYGGVGAAGTPGKLPVDRTWKIRDDEGNDWYIPLFKYG